ncbi:MAG: hypothetical protein CM15mP77_3050 [Synechococcus sp.]|nr:MAG: hypothetical protein CM15mP77_3050 [Synechococcus sp.]
MRSGFGLGPPRTSIFRGCPDRIRPPEDVVELLATPLAQPAHSCSKNWEAALRSQTGGGLDPETAERIRSLGISGLDLEAYPSGFIPRGSVRQRCRLPQDERVPQAGLEQSRNSELLRHEQPRRLRRGATEPHFLMIWHPERFMAMTCALQLTSMPGFRSCRQSLAAQVAKWKAQKGAAIVMDATNGELLVLASTPTYDPNRYWDFPTGRFREWSVQDLYEPGSTFKPINLALALQDGAIQATDRVNDVGKLMVGGWPINNHDKKAHGLVDFATVFAGLPATSEWFRRCGASTTTSTGTG